MKTEAQRAANREHMRRKRAMSPDRAAALDARRAGNAPLCKHKRAGWCNACWMAEQRQNAEYRLEEKRRAHHRKAA